MTMRQINYIIGVGCVALAVFLYSQARNIMAPAHLYPTTVISAIGLLGVLLVIQNHFKPTEQSNISTPFKGTRWSVIVGTILGAALYIWLVDVVGFYFVSFFFLIIATYLLSGEKKFSLKTLTNLTIMSTVVVGIVYLAFRVFLKVQTPTGIFF